MSKHKVVYYQEGKKQTKIVSDVTNIVNENNLLIFSIKDSDDVVFLESNILSYKKIGE